MKDATQFGDNDADCHVDPPTAGSCHVHEEINQNGATIQNTCNNSDCTTGQECLNGTCFVCEVGGEAGAFCPPPPRCLPPNCGGIALSGTALSFRSLSATLRPVTRSLPATRLLTT
jgi:hypothetical protein